MVTVPEVVVYTSVTFPDLVGVPGMVLESVVDKVTVVVTEGYVTDPVAPSMLRGSTVPERVTIAAVSEAEVVVEEAAVVVESANAPVSSAAAIHSERILTLAAVVNKTMIYCTEG